MENNGFEVFENSNKKKFFVATAINWGEITVEIFTDPLAYGRAINAAVRDHENDDVDTYTYGDNHSRFEAEGDEVKVHYGDLYIAHMSDMGLFVEFFDKEDEYKERLLELLEEEYKGRMDNVIYNGPEVEYEPRSVDDDEDCDLDISLPSGP